jgi:hypothetical protein
MAFARTTDTFWYALGVAEVDAEEGAADVARSAVIRSSTYCVTCTRISMPVFMRQSGNICDDPITKDGLAKYMSNERGHI